MRPAAGRARFRARLAHGRAGPHGRCPMSTARPRRTARGSGRGPRTRRRHGLRAERGEGSCKMRRGDAARRNLTAAVTAQSGVTTSHSPVTHGDCEQSGVCVVQQCGARCARDSQQTRLSRARTHDTQLEHTPRAGGAHTLARHTSHGVRWLFVCVVAHVCRAGWRSAKASIRRNVTAVPSSPSPDSKTSRHHICTGAAPTSAPTAL